jgi:hypothetical protein
LEGCEVVGLTGEELLEVHPRHDQGRSERERGLSLRLATNQW